MFLTSPGSRNGGKVHFLRKSALFRKMGLRGPQKRAYVFRFWSPGARGAHFSEKVHFLHFWSSSLAGQPALHEAEALGPLPYPPAPPPRAAVALCPRRHGRSAPRRHSRSAPRGRETPPLSMPWSGCWRTPPTPMFNGKAFPIISPAQILNKMNSLGINCFQKFFQQSDHLAR